MKKRVLFLFSIAVLVFSSLGPLACGTPVAPDALSILAVNVDTNSDTSVTISWATDRDATSQVEYGTSTSYGTSTPLTTALVKEHSVTISGLTPGASYHFKAKSTDADDVSGASSDQAFNTTGLVISSVVAAPTSNSATITWVTDDAASSQVKYGTTTAYGTTTTDTIQTKAHSVTLINLTPGATYHYQVLSDSGTDTDESADKSLATAAAVRLRMGNNNPPDNLNVMIPAGEILPYKQLMYDTLLNVELDGAWTPRLATSWSWDATTNTWTFILRQGVKWHDGEMFTAADVEATYDAAVELAGSYYNEWAKYVEEVTIVDDYTIKFELTAALVGWPANLREERAEIIPEHIWSSQDVTTWLNMDDPIGTGPFKYKEGDFLTYDLFERNVDYWGGAPMIDEVLLTEYANLDAEILAFRAGQLDAISAKTMRDPAIVPTLLSDPNVSFAVTDSNRYDMVRLNLRRSPNGIKEFRQAVSLAIDKERITSVVYHGYATPAPTVPFIPGALQDDSIIWPGLDMTDAARIAAANALLDAIPGMSQTPAAVEGVIPPFTRTGPVSTSFGPDVAATPLSFELLLGPATSHYQAATILKENLADIGIQVNLTTTGYGTLFGILKNEGVSDWDWYMGGHAQPVDWDAGFAAYLDDGTDYSSAFIAGPIGFVYPTIQDKMTASLTATGTTRDDLIVEIQELWADYLPIIPVHTTTIVAVYRTDHLKGWDLVYSADPPYSYEPLYYKNLIGLEPA